MALQPCITTPGSATKDPCHIHIAREAIPVLLPNCTFPQNANVVEQNRRQGLRSESARSTQRTQTTDRCLSPLTSTLISTLLPLYLGLTTDPCIISSSQNSPGGQSSVFTQPLPTGRNRPSLLGSSSRLTSSLLQSPSPCPSPLPPMALPRFPRPLPQRTPRRKPSSSECARPPSPTHFDGETLA